MDWKDGISCTASVRHLIKALKFLVLGRGSNVGRVPMRAAASSYVIRFLFVIFGV